MVLAPFFAVMAGAKKMRDADVRAFVEQGASVAGEGKAGEEEGAVDWEGGSDSSSTVVDGEEGGVNVNASGDEDQGAAKEDLVGEGWLDWTMPTNGDFPCLRCACDGTPTPCTCRM